MSAWEEALADAEAVFGYQRDLTHQERAHAYLARRGLADGASHPATLACVADLMRRAYDAGRGDARAWADVRRCARDADALAERLAEACRGGGS